MKILIVKLSSIGDVIHTFPALSELAALRPDLTVDWLVDDSLVDFARLHPAIRETIPFAQRRLRWPPGRWPAYVAARRELRRRLRDGHYDLVVDLQGLLKSALAARLAAAPVAGLDATSIREPVASRLYARRYAVSRDLHAVERNRLLLAAAIGYDPSARPPAFGLAAGGRPASAGLPERYCILFHSASWPSKLWSEANWRRLIAHLAERDIAAMLPWGDAEERARAVRLAAGGSRSVVLPGRLEGGELAALIGGAALAVGLDSGLMHLSDMLGVPGVWLFGPTDPGLTGPSGANQTVIRSTGPNAPCRTRACAHRPEGRPCMDFVDVGRVLAAVDALLEESGSGAAVRPRPAPASGPAP